MLPAKPNSWEVLEIEVSELTHHGTLVLLVEEQVAQGPRYLTTSSL